jgi:hypothetical protein
MKLKIKDNINTIEQFNYSYYYDSNKKGKNFTCDMTIWKLNDLRIVNNCIFDAPE